MAEGTEEELSYGEAAERLETILGKVEEGEVDIDPTQSALIYVLLWTAVEALDGNWSPPTGFTGD